MKNLNIRLRKLEAARNPENVPSIHVIEVPFNSVEDSGQRFLEDIGIIVSPLDLIVSIQKFADGDFTHLYSMSST